MRVEYTPALPEMTDVLLRVTRIGPHRQRNELKLIIFEVVESTVPVTRVSRIYNIKTGFHHLTPLLGALSIDHTNNIVRQPQEMIDKTVIADLRHELRQGCLHVVPYGFRRRREPEEGCNQK